MDKQPPRFVKRDLLRVGQGLHMVYVLLEDHLECCLVLLVVLSASQSVSGVVAA